MTDEKSKKPETPRTSADDPAMAATPTEAQAVGRGSEQPTEEVNPFFAGLRRAWKIRLDSL